MLGVLSVSFTKTRNVVTRMLNEKLLVWGDRTGFEER